MAGGSRGHLLRIFGVAFGLAAVVGGTIGQGILRAPGLVAGGAPMPWLILALWALGALIVLNDATVTVEVATSVRRTGGAYAVVTRAFGRFAGLAAGIANWLAYVAAIAFVGVVFAEFLHRLGIAAALSNGVLAVLLIAVIWGVQALGARIGGVSLEIGSAIKALVFAGLIAALLIAPRGAPAVPALAVAAPVTLVGVIVAIRSVVTTYWGWEMACYYPEEMTDPGRDIARATFGGLALVAAIYLVMNVALLRAMTPAQMAGSTLVAADAAVGVFGAASGTVVTAISVISLVTICNVLLMTFARLLFAVGRDAGVPLIADVSASGSPRWALAATALAAMLLASIGVYAILLGVSALLGVATYCAISLSAMTLRRLEPALDRPFRMPFFPAPAIVSVLVNGAMAVAFVFESPVLALGTTAGLGVLTVVVYVVTRRSAQVAVA